MNKTELDVLTISDIQEKLSGEETLLEYLLTDEGLFILKIIHILELGIKIIELRRVLINFTTEAYILRLIIMYV